MSHYIKKIAFLPKGRPIEEDIIVKGSKIFPAYAGRPSREVDDLEEEIKQKQREFAGLIYFQRCLEFGR